MFLLSRCLDVVLGSYNEMKVVSRIFFDLILAGPGEAPLKFQNIFSYRVPSLGSLFWLSSTNEG
jgi:hypothetical protein